MSDRYVETNGIRLHYLDHAGAAPTVVLAPGLTANAHSFDGLVAAGLDGRAHVLALDLRGRGESDQPDSGYAMEDHAARRPRPPRRARARARRHGRPLLRRAAHLLARRESSRARRTLHRARCARARSTRRGRPDQALARPPRSVYASWDEYLDARQVDAVLRRGGWIAEVERYFRADVRVRPDGTVQARSTPEHIQAAVEGTFASTGRSSPRASRSRRCSCAPGQLWAAGVAADPLARGRRRTAALMADCRVVDGIGNHLTFVFGAGAPPDACDRGVPG